MSDNVNYYDPSDSLNLECSDNFVNETVENTNIEITSLGTDDENYVNNDGDNKKNVSFASYSEELNDDACLMCRKKVYPMELLNADGKVYHKNCFRCFKCRTPLSLTNFNVSNNTLFCKTHLMERFKLRGRYDDDADIQQIHVHSADKEDIPTIDTKSLLAKFRELESTSPTVPRFNSGSGSGSGKANVRYMQPTDDIIRSEDLAPDEKPVPDSTKSMIARFKAMETKRNVPTPENSRRMQEEARVASYGVNPNIRLQGSPSALAAASNTNNESSSEMAADLPEFGITKNLMSKFEGASGDHEENNEPSL